MNENFRLAKVNDGDVYYLDKKLISLKHFCYNEKRLQKRIGQYRVYVCVEKGELYFCKSKSLLDFYGTIWSIEKDKYIVEFHYSK